MFFKFLSASFILCLLPGPDIIFVMTQSISRGAKPAFAVTLGLCSGLFFHTAAVALGVAALMAASPVFMTWITIFGAAYLFWLGLSCLPILAKNKKTEAREGTLSQKNGAEEYSFFAIYKQGLIMNLCNPKVILVFLSFLPAFVPEGSALPKGLYIAFLGFCFAITAFCVFGAVSLLGGKLNDVLQIEHYTRSKVFVYATAFIYWFIAGWIFFGC